MLRGEEERIWRRGRLGDIRERFSKVYAKFVNLSEDIIYYSSPLIAFISHMIFLQIARRWVKSRRSIYIYKSLLLRPPKLFLAYLPQQRGQVLVIRAAEIVFFYTFAFPFVLDTNLCR